MMTPRKRVAWSKTVEESGVAIRIYERAPGALLYREYRHEGTKDRQSLGHRDRALAEQQVRALAKRIAELRFAGQTGNLTLGQLTALYLKHRSPLLTAARKRSVEGMITLLERHFGRDLAVDDLSPHLVEGYIAVRRSGALQSPRHRVPAPGVRTGTIRNELHLLATMCTWAQGFRLSGKRLLTVNPLAGIEIPHEKNMRRPIATAERFTKMLDVAARVDPQGRFRLMLVLARRTGRRINAICSLRAFDVLRTREQLLAALGASGLDLKVADQWTHGAIRWSEASDKLGFESVAPISRECRAEIDRYLREHPRVGDAPLFSATTDPARAVRKSHADYWHRRATTLAKLERVDRGGFHMWRRLFASERRHLPAQDVAAAGGWRSIQVMRDSYQQADAETVLNVVENEAPGLTKDTPAKDAQA